MTLSHRHLLQQSYKLVELLAMAGSFVLAAWLIAWQAGGVSIAEIFAIRLKVSNFVLFVFLLVVWHLLFVAVGLYRPRRLSSSTRETLDILKATSLGSLAILNAGFLFNIRLVTPRFVLAFWAISSVVTIAGRLLTRAALSRARLRGRNLRNVVMVGTNPRARRFARDLESQPRLGYRVLGFVDEEWVGMRDFQKEGGKILAGLDELAAVLRTTVVDELVIALPLCSSYERCARIVTLCEQQGITVRFLSDIFNLSLAKATVETFQDVPIVTLQTGAIEGWPALVKRVLDVAVAGVALAVVAPLFAVVALVIKRTSPGPVFFVQERIGLNKRKFRLYKFRTMVADAEQQQVELEHLNEAAGPVFKIKNDPRVTPVGKLLRKTSVDELPQLLNVLRGDMSLVGPRPLPVRDWQGFDQDWHRRRFSVRPGITCTWQVKGRSEIPFETWMQLDMDYIDHWSLWLDLRILLRTIPTVLRGSGAA